MPKPSPLDPALQRSLDELRLVLNLRHALTDEQAQRAFAATEEVAATLRRKGLAPQLGLKVRQWVRMTAEEDEAIGRIAKAIGSSKANTYRGLVLLSLYAWEGAQPGKDNQTS